MLVTSPEDRRRPALAESDPLPPEDRVVASSNKELESLYRRHRDRIVRYFSRSASPDLAQDLCQQLFVRLAARTSRGTIDAPRAYLDRSARNVANDHHRRRGRLPTFECDDFGPDAFGGPDPSHALEARDTLRRLEAAIESMKPRTREIFLAHRFDGLSYREIAAATGLGVKAVEKHMSRAIAHIDRRCA